MISCAFLSKSLPYAYIFIVFDSAKVELKATKAQITHLDLVHGLEILYPLSVWRVAVQTPCPLHICGNTFESIQAFTETESILYKLQSKQSQCPHMYPTIY